MKPPVAIRKTCGGTCMHAHTQAPPVKRQEGGNFLVTLWVIRRHPETGKEGLCTVSEESGACPLKEGMLGRAEGNRLTKVSQSVED